MFLYQSRFEINRKLQLCSVALVSLSIWSEATWAHVGPDGGDHHEILNWAHQLTDLQAWLTALNLSPWMVGLAAVAAGAWLAGRPVLAKYKRKVGAVHAEDAHARDQP